MHALLAPARLLLARGADREARDNRGRTAADVARLLGYVDVAQELGARDIPGVTATLRQRSE
jgi:ankyrin repeat protein